MLNFVKNDYPYCIHFLDCYDEQQENVQNTRLTSLGKVLNKVLLQKYKDYIHIWKDIGSALNTYLAIYDKEGTDSHTIGLTMK